MSYWKLRYKISLVLLIGVIFFGFGKLALADNETTASTTATVSSDTNTAPRIFSIFLGFAYQRVARDISVFDDALEVKLATSTLRDFSDLSIGEMNGQVTEPWQLARLSGVYQITFSNNRAINENSAYTLALKYDPGTTNGYHKLYFYNPINNSWEAQSSTDLTEEGIIQTTTKQSQVIAAVFSDTGKMAAGKASWYAYKNGNFAASPDWPIGSKLRVYSLDYETGDKYKPYIDITVNDWGPDRSIFPDRVIDLDKVAFSQLAPLSQGTVKVKVEPLELAETTQAAISKIKAADAPGINAKAAIVVDSKTGDVIYEKNSEEVLPIASLSKMVALKTYIDLQKKLDLKATVTYKTADEEYNYRYCSKWESARVRLSNGDQVTVKDLIYSSLVGSANNAVESLVRVSGVSRDKFIILMNEKVKEWGATQTEFVEPTGLSPNNVSSARDYAIIIKEILKDKTIADASVTSKYSFTTINTKKKHTIVNTSSLVKTNPEFTVTGSKTGYLDEAGYCLVTQAAKDGNNLIAVTLNSETRDQSFNEAKDLLNYSFKELAI